MDTTKSKLVAWLQSPAPPALSLMVWSVLGARCTLLGCSFLPIWSVADPSAPFSSPYQFETLGNILGRRYPDSTILGHNTITADGFLRAHRVFVVAAVVLATGLVLGWVLHQRTHWSVARSYGGGDDALNRR
jgi:hypothetical protein